MHLIHPLLDEGRTLYLKWYSSPRLYIELHNRGTNACGIVRENCLGLPKDVDKKALKRGETEVQQLPLLTRVIGNDKHSVTVLSNCHVMVDMIETNLQISKPRTFMNIIRIMGGGAVDLVDQVTKQTGE
jgi:hypothetical protein